MESMSIPPSMRSINLATSGFRTPIADAAEIEKIVDYVFERKDSANILAIHPDMSLIAYLINVKKTSTSKPPNTITPTTTTTATTSINTTPAANNTFSSSTPSLLSSPLQQHQQQQTPVSPRSVTIRVLDYVSRRRCLTKGAFYARPTDCAFAINPTSSSTPSTDTVKLAIVDRLVNVYIYNINIVNDDTDMRAVRVALIRSDIVSPMPPVPANVNSPVRLVWCPYVPCDDSDAGGLTLAVSSDKRIEIFAIDRIESKPVASTRELPRNELSAWQAYKSIESNTGDAQVVAIGLSPDCSTLAAALSNNEVKFFSAYVNDPNDTDSMHIWSAQILDGSSVSQMFLLDDYPSLLKDSTKLFWGAAILATKTGQMQLIDLRTWSVYQTVSFIIETGTKNFDYQIDSTSNFMVAINGNQAFVVHFDHGTYGATSDSSTQSSSASGDSSSSPSATSVTDQLLLGFNLNSSSDIINRTNNDCSSQTLSKLLNGCSPMSADRNHLHNITTNTTTATARTTDITPLPRITKVTGYTLHNPAYSFAVRRRNDDQLELFILSPLSLEKYSLRIKASSSSSSSAPLPPSVAVSTTHSGVVPLQNSSTILASASAITTTTVVASASPVTSNVGATPKPTPPSIKPSVATPKQTPNKQQQQRQQDFLTTTPVVATSTPPSTPSTATTAAAAAAAAAISASTQQLHTATTISNSVVVPTPAEAQMMTDMDRMAAALFTQLNTAFSRGLEEFLGEVRAEVNNLKTRITALSREIKKLQIQQHH